MLFRSATINYNYTDPNGCSAASSTTITVVADPTVTFANISTSCVGSAPVTLSTGSPAGGVYSGPGVSNGVFDPTVAGGPGTYNITYTYTNPTGCTGTATGTVTVGNPATVSIMMTPGTGCSARSATAISAVGWRALAKKTARPRGHPSGSDRESCQIGRAHV